MIKAKVRFAIGAPPLLSLMAAVFIATLVAPAAAHAGGSATTAPLNVPGRYAPPKPTVAVSTTKHVASPAGRYVSGTAATTAAAPKTTVAPTKQRTPTQPRAVKNSPLPEADKKPASVAVQSPPPVTTTQSSSLSSSPNSSGEIGARIAAALPDLKTLYAKRINDADVSAVRAFYESQPDRTLWLDDNGFTAKGHAAIAELGKAEDWGLSVSAFNIPDTRGPNTTPTQRARAELTTSMSVLRYVRHARGGRVNPRGQSRLFDLKSDLLDPAEILGQISAASDPAAYLRDQHPTYPQFASLRQALLALRAPEKKAPAQKTKPEIKIVQLPDGPTLREGMTHEHVALLRQRLKVPATGDSENKFDEPLKTALEKFQSKAGLSADGVVGPRTRATLNGKPKAKRKPASKKARIQKIVINMERWRWMPRDPGDFYIMNNIPEFKTRVYQDDKTIYTEKIIVGKTVNPTPAFSAPMKLVVFHPSWGVPNGIKRTEILPYLKQTSGFFGLGGADTRILKRHNLRVTRNGRPVDASKVNWSKVDIRNYTFIQPPSSTNVLGKVKFRFPNKHDVYMHDTPERHLFKSARRTFSHGCIRVHKPRRLAEVILKHDKGWSSEKVGNYWRRGGTVKLDDKFDVHTGYFTAWAGENGKVRTFADIYSHDRKLAVALGRNPLSLRPDAVADGDPAPVRRIKRKKKKKKSPGPPTVADIFASVFSP